jgi:hypothetical protein
MLSRAHFFGANLSEADLTGAVLREADLRSANLMRARLNKANLDSSTMLGADLTGADLTDCRIYGVSAWSLKMEETTQQNLVITPYDEPEITVDNIEVAQFIYLLLKKQKIREVIDTITSKVVLILGRFTDDRKAVLDALREELRKRDYRVLQWAQALFLDLRCFLSLFRALCVPFACPFVCLIACPLLR